MNYYLMNDNKIIFFDTDKSKILNTLEFMPEFSTEDIQETEREIVYRNDEFVFADEISDELLSDAIEQKLEENKTAYNNALKSGVVYKNTLFDCDTLAAVRIMGQMVAAQAAAIESEDTIDWFDYNYVPVTLTITEFMELAGIVTLNTRRIETLNCSYNTAIRAAQSMEELDTIEISYSDTNLPDIQDSASSGEEEAEK